MTGTTRQAFGLPVHIDNRVPPTRMLAVGPKGIEGVIVNVETYWALRHKDDPWWLRFAVGLRRRTLARTREIQP